MKLPRNEYNSSAALIFSALKYFYYNNIISRDKKYSVYKYITFGVTSSDKNATSCLLVKVFNRLSEEVQCFQIHFTETKLHADNLERRERHEGINRK